MKKDLNSITFESEESFKKLNSITKYPSIKTYHTIDKGKLLPELTPNGFDGSKKIYLTEKIDGTNARIVYLNGDWLIGSRENILYAKGDRIGDPAQGIANILRPMMGQRLRDFDKACEKDIMYVIYGECYGGRITKASRQYADDENLTGFRVFDITEIPIDSLTGLMLREPEDISKWREGDATTSDGHNMFMNIDALKNTSAKLGFMTVPYIELGNIENLKGADMPTSLDDAYNWLLAFDKSHAGLGTKQDGRAEGVVARAYDRSVIRKLRFEDYEKTLRTRK